MMESWMAEIEDRLRKIGLAVDNYDEGLLLSCCCDKASFDFGDRFRGSPEAFIAFLSASRLDTLAMDHTITDISVSIENDYEAISTSAVTARIVVKIGQKVQKREVTGRYEDHWSREQSHWLLRERRYSQVNLNIECGQAL